MKIIQIIAKIILYSIFIPIALIMTPFTFAFALLGLPLSILMALADGDPISEAFKQFIELSFLTFYIFFDR